MKFRILVFIVLLCFSSYGQDFQWVRQIKGLEDKTETASYIEVDKSGNTYTLGKSQSIEYDIDPTLTGVQIINNRNSLVPNPEDIYLIKLNNNGDFIWGKTLSVLKDNDSVLGLNFDSQGNIYVLAFITELYNNESLVYGYGSVNVIKIDPSGNEIYRHKIKNQGNLNSGQVYAISSFDIDSSDNICIVGAFKNTVQLDNIAQNNLSANGNSMYVLKMNQNGTILWVKNLNFISSGTVRLKIDTSDNINLAFNCVNPSDSGNFLRIIKINNQNGDQIWLKTIENAALSNFVTDANNKFVITGNASNSLIVDLNPNPNSSKIIQNNSFILFLDVNGNYLDSKLFDLNINFGAIEIDELNNYHFGGNFTNNNIDFDPSPDFYYLSSSGFSNNGYYNSGFYLKLNSIGGFDKALLIGNSPLNDRPCYSSATNAIRILNENIFVAGVFAGNCDLDPTISSSFMLNSFNFNVINSDGFILKLGNCETIPPSAAPIQNFCSADKPTIKSLTPNSSSIKWYESINSTTQLNETTSLINGQQYFASQQIGSCPESQRLPVIVKISPNPTMPLASNQTFCYSENANISDIVVIGQNIKWYDSLTAINTLSSSILLQSNTTYYATQTLNNCESERVPVNITITAAQLPIAISPQTFCIQQNATLNEISIKGQNIKWYDAPENGNQLPNTTTLQNGITYYASQTINGCESEIIPVLINIQNTPAPTGNVNQSFCSSQNPNLDTIQISGISIKWYNSAGTLLINSTSLQNGMTYYASQTENNCESLQIGIKISIVNTPATPTANTNQSFCKKENASLSTIQIAGQDIKWYETNFSTTSLPNSTLLENNKSYYASQTIGCESNRIAILVRIYDTPLPTGNNNQQFCIDANAQIFNLNILGSNIKWYDSLTSITTLSETTALSNGVTYYATQTLNECESERIAITVKIQETQAPFGNPNQTFCPQENAKISNIIIDGQNIKWYSTLSSYTPLPETIPLKNRITYYASQTINNCESARIPIKITIYEAIDNYCINLLDQLPYPKFFTPNNDGFNDTWSINFAFLKPNSSIYIFDRYGKLITILSQNQVWNGTYNGLPLPSSDYWFQVMRLNDTIFKSHFTLKR